MTKNHYQIQKLVKKYGKQTVLDISLLEFASGQFVALMGKNGSGKSTLMRLLAQQELYQKGQITYKGTDLSSPFLKLNPELVFLAEDISLPIALSIVDWSYEFEKIYTTYDRKLFQELAKYLEVDINKQLSALSRGQKVKALFCLFSAKRPQTYILDEITSVLDTGSRWTIMNFLKQEAERGCSIILSTNIATEVQGFATDLVFLENGKITFQARSSAIEKLFVKIKLDNQTYMQKKRELHKQQFKPVRFNSDKTISLLIATQSLDAEFQKFKDSREITIDEVAAFFTVGEF